MRTFFVAFALLSVSSQVLTSAAPAASKSFVIFDVHKLEKTKRPYSVVVIDHIEEKPTEN
jgi:uncharacterized protein (TIGR03435 family)